MVERNPSSHSPDHTAEWVVIESVLGITGPGTDFFVPTADQLYRVFVEDSAPPDVFPLNTPALTFSRYPLNVELRISARPDPDNPALSVSAWATGHEEEDALGSLRVRTADHVVCGGTWYPLSPGAISEALATLDDAGIHDCGPINLRQYLKLLQLGITHAGIRDLAGNAPTAANQKAPRGQSPPVGFQGTLYPYQTDGWRWLHLIASQDLGGILADEMGLGKTVQIAAFLLEEHAAGRRPALVIAPGTLLPNWRRELGKFTPDLEVTLHRGPERTGFPNELRMADVIVTSYDTLIRDLSLFQQIDWNVVILDEAQAIKNRDTRRATAVKLIPRRVGLAVTGTPVENRLSDLWSITDFALPGFLGNISEFEQAFGNDADGAAALEPLVSPILLRRLVRDVAKDLPDRIDIPQVLELSASQADEYEAVRQGIVDEYGDRANLVALTKLRMFCAHPALVQPTDADPVEASVKYARLTEILEEVIERAQKAIIFTSFTDMADLLVGDLSRRFGVPTTYIDGRVEIDSRQTVVDVFSAVEGSAILVLNPRAAGTGLNITAANHVIHYNLEWNPAVEDQASARAHRRGQKLPVTVHRLFYADTVEEVIDARLTDKRALAGAAVVGTDGSEEGAADIRAALARSPVRGIRSDDI